MKELTKQIQFLLEIDQLKQICRRNYVLRGDRRENVAEHSWHLALMLLILAEHADEPFDRLRALKMALIHDIVEIDAGDTFVYDDDGNEDKREREQAAARRIFELLPAAQADEYRQLWDEFECGVSPEARFALAVDRLLPIIQNYYADNDGRTWTQHGITRQDVLQVNAPIREGSKVLWEYAKFIVDQATKKGYLLEKRSGPPRL